MSEYIKREAAIGAILDKYVDYAEITDAIKGIPSTDVVEVRHGKWEWASCTYDRVPCEMEYICSCCHHKVITHGGDEPWEKYCPNCGAKMDGEEQDHD